jgi:Rad3-related DNA helicase
MRLEYSDLYLLEIIKDKYDSGKLQMEQIEADVSSAIAWEGIDGNVMPMFLNAIEENYENLLKDKLDLKKLDYNENLESFYKKYENIEDQLNEIKNMNNLYSKRPEFERIEDGMRKINKEIRDIHVELTGMAAVPVFKNKFNSNEHRYVHNNFKKFYSESMHKCFDFRDYLDKEDEKKSEKIKRQNKIIKNERLILGILDKEFPTDHINEENREAIIELLNKGFLKDKPLSALQSKNLKKLIILFDVKTPVAQF